MMMMSNHRVCTILGCTRPLRARGWCITHWYRWRKNGDPMSVKRVAPSYASLSERFWAHVRKGESCWEWMGYRDPKGYGRFKPSKASSESLAHRFAWTQENGAIPEGLFVLHRCDNPACVKPDHLFLGTRGDNNNDMARKGRHGRYKARFTHCPHGHPYAGENLVRTSGDWRVCRTCKNQRVREWRERQKVGRQ